MTRAVRTGIAGLLMCGVLATAPVVFGGPSDGGTARSIDAPAAALATATRGTMVQTVPLPPPPVTVAGDSLEIPADSGTGRRAVYSKGIQRVWLIEADGQIFATYRVSGRMDQPRLGTFSVFSRSANTCSSSHPDICMRYMVRFTKGARGDNIGFHEIPRRNGVPMQTTDELGLALSAGCIRQATPDAQTTWAWAQIGTVVVVVP